MTTAESKGVNISDAQAQMSALDVKITEFTKASATTPSATTPSAETPPAETPPVEERREASTVPNAEKYKDQI